MVDGVLGPTLNKGGFAFQKPTAFPFLLYLYSVFSVRVWRGGPKGACAEEVNSKHISE